VRPGCQEKKNHSPWQQGRNHSVSQ
jgi:hypothetical protein